jgi:hypothetical protein
MKTDFALPLYQPWLNIGNSHIRTVRVFAKHTSLAFGMLFTALNSTSALGNAAKVPPASVSNAQGWQSPQAQAPGEKSGSTTLARTTFIQLMDEDFKKRDFDGNGKATRAEIEQFEKQTAVIKAQQSNRVLFLQLDTDRNGNVTPAEFTALIPAAGLPDVSDVMKRFDSNRDQIITLVEYRAATLSNFDQRDADKDGVLSSRELQPGIEQPTDSDKRR